MQELEDDTTEEQQLSRSTPVRSTITPRPKSAMPADSGPVNQSQISSEGLAAVHFTL